MRNFSGMNLLYLVTDISCCYTKSWKQKCFFRNPKLLKFYPAICNLLQHFFNWGIEFHVRLSGKDYLFTVPRSDITEYCTERWILYILPIFLLLNWIFPVSLIDKTSCHCLLVFVLSFHDQFPLGQILFIPHLPVLFSLFVLPEKSDVMINLVLWCHWVCTLVNLPLHQCTQWWTETSLLPLSTVVGEIENEAKIWCAMRTFGSSCLFKILMASPLLPWGRWPFLGQLPIALLLSSLCWNASKPSVYTLFSSSAKCIQHRLIMCLSAATITLDFY